MRKRSWPMVAAPLEGDAVGYRKELARLGYSGSKAADHLRVMADLSGWLSESGLEPAELDSARLDRFLADRRSRGCSFPLTTRDVAPSSGYLRSVGAVPEATVPEPEGPVDCLLEEFVAYLESERGLAWETIVGYRRVARAILVSCAPDLTSPACGVDRLGAGEISAFVVSECAQRAAPDRRATRSKRCGRYLDSCTSTATPTSRWSTAFPRPPPGGRPAGRGRWNQTR